MIRKAIIIGIKGTKLTSRERYLIKLQKPWGIILFGRNIKTLNQTKALIKDIRSTIKDKKYPILIDQEGGKVSRLNNIIDLSIFSQDLFGRLYKKNKKFFFNYYSIYINAVSSILNDIGINVNTVPVLDLRRSNSHDIIGTRSYSNKKSVIKKLGQFCVNQYHKNNIATVMKHIPGHGLSKVDSHFKLPIIKTSKKTLYKKDFSCFKDCKSLFSMTAHIIYNKYDRFNTATHSKIVINEVVRKYINFKGILISDDISMKSLKYGYISNALRALEAGCNLVLHCNGNIREMEKLIKILPTIDSFTQKKTSHFYDFLG